MTRLTSRIVIGLLMCAPVAAMAADAGFTDRIIVKYRNTSALAAAAGQATQLRGTDLPAARLGVTMNRLRATALGAQVLKADRRLSLSEAAQLARDIVASDPNVEYAEPDRILRHTIDAQRSALQRAVALLRSRGRHQRAAGLGQVHGHRRGGRGDRHGLSPACRSRRRLPARATTSSPTPSSSNDGNGRDTDASDPGDWINPGECGPGDPAAFEASSWHGTHVSGTIAARTNNSLGVAGVAFNARIVPARVLGKCGGFTSDIADAIVWTSGGTVSGVPANANPAKVLSISLGGSGACDTTTQNAINSARSRGASVIVAAGNENANAANFYAGELLGRRDRGGGGPQWRQGVVLELRRDRGSGGARRQRRRQQRVVDAECRFDQPGSRQLRAVQRHVHGHAACLGRGGAHAVGEAHADARPGDVHPAEHGARFPGHVFAMRFGHRECQRRGGRGHRRHDAAIRRAPSPKSSPTTRAPHRS